MWYAQSGGTRPSSPATPSVSTDFKKATVSSHGNNGVRWVCNINRRKLRMMVATEHDPRNSLYSTAKAGGLVPRARGTCPST